MIGKFMCIDFEIVPRKTIELPRDCHVIYEVVRLVQGKILFLKDHLDRLESSVQFYREDYKLPREAIRGALNKLILCNNFVDNNIRIEIWVKESKEQFFAIGKMGLYPSLKEYQEGVVVETWERSRNNPHVKEANVDFTKAAQQKLQEDGVFELLLVEEGLVSEGSRSNIFFIKDGTLYTTPDAAVLEGITRKKVMEVAREMGLALQKAPMTLDQLAHLDSAFLTGTSLHILPIKMINQVSYNVQEEVLLTLMRAFQHKVDEDVKGVV